MDLVEFSLDKLIPKAGATGLDANIQPTFGNLDIGTNVGTTSSISLTASSTSVIVGSEFDVDIKIDTKGTPISEFEIVIDFDTAKLTVKDSDTTKAGTQIQFLDTIFEVEDTGGNNVSLSTGRIVLRAATPTNIAYEINNRSIARIKFQSQATGTTVIETVGGSSGSKLINSRGTAIATIINNLTISSTQRTGSTNSGTTTGTPPTTTNGSSGSSNNGNTTGGNLPDTGIEDIAAVAPLLIGVILVSFGITLSNARKKHQNGS
jgi:hypothetical protein